MRIARVQRLDGSYQDITAYEPGEFPWKQVSKLARKSRRKARKGMSILNAFGTFDIETSTVNKPDKNAFMYHWQMCIGGIPVYGRTWEEWTSLMQKAIDVLELSDTRKLVIYVHNLGFEFQFMRDFLQKKLGGFEGFYINKRKPLSVRLAGMIEFRCSYKLTNMSLERACDFEKGVEIGKQSGNLDYRKLRTPFTPLTDQEFAYCIADVVSLYQLIERRLINEGDDLDSIPLTSTGYVRRDCRRSTEKDKGYREFFKSLTMTPEVYTLLKEAARGGDTHANRRLSGKMLSGIDSFDVQSSYPAQLKMKQFPMTKFTPYGDVNSKEEFDTLLREHACLFRSAFENIRLKREIAMPYISSDKCSHLLGARYDNGRVLQADALLMTVTDVDFRLLERQYEWDGMYISDMHIADYGYLPESILQVVDKYFRLKTELKGEIAKAKNAGDKELLADLEYEYGKSKNRLNAIFGMMYTDPVRTQIVFEGGEWKEERPDIEEALDKYYASRNSFLYYPWGVWTTAHAREHLADLVEITGQDTTAYCDTDSSKCYADDRIRAAVAAKNKEIMALAESRAAYCEYDGVRYYMGIYEHEAYYDRFKTLGAKKYVYEEGGILHVTISGVNKAKAPDELGKIDSFEPGFIFHDAGGLEMTYIDSYIRDITVNGQTFTSGSAIAATDGTYEIGITDEYAEVIGYNTYLDIDKGCICTPFKTKKERKKQHEETGRKCKGEHKWEHTGKELHGGKGVRYTAN